MGTTTTKITYHCSVCGEEADGGTDNAPDALHCPQHPTAVIDSIKSTYDEAATRSAEAHTVSGIALRATCENPGSVDKAEAYISAKRNHNAWQTALRNHHRDT